MGRIIDKRVIGFRCEVRKCSAKYSILPQDAGHWSEHLADLTQIIDLGWAVVLNPQIRTYCPEHSEQVFMCTCRTHPHRRHTCVDHDEEAAANIWVSGDTPKAVAEYLEVLGANQ